MKIYRISSRKKGEDFSISMNYLYGSRQKLIETIQEIKENKLSFSRGSVPIVSKSLIVKGAFFIMDGHHRIMEDLIKGQREVFVHWSEHVPLIDAGIGNNMPEDTMKIADFLKEMAPLLNADSYAERHDRWTNNELV